MVRETDVIAGREPHGHARDLAGNAAGAGLDGVRFAVTEGIVGVNLVVGRHHIRARDQQRVVDTADLVRLSRAFRHFLHDVA